MDAGLDVLNSFIGEVGPSSLWLNEVTFEKADSLTKETDTSTLKNKYHFLKPLSSMDESKEAKTNGLSKDSIEHQTNGIPKNNTTQTDDLPKPKIMMFRPDDVSLEWKTKFGIGAGLVNLGNTCFMNSVLQCLTYCPPLVNYLMYMSDLKSERMLYKLNAVLVHFGNSCNSGHYYCYVKSPSGVWFLMDDTRVSSVGLNHVLNQNAYILFYVRTPSTNPSRPSPIQQSIQTNGNMKPHISSINNVSSMSKPIATSSSTSTTTNKLNPISLKPDNRPRLITESTRCQPTKNVATNTNNHQSKSDTLTVKSSSTSNSLNNNNRSPTPIPTRSSITPPSSVPASSLSPMVKQNKSSKTPSVLKNLVEYSDSSDDETIGNNQVTSGKIYAGVGHLISSKMLKDSNVSSEKQTISISKTSPISPIISPVKRPASTAIPLPSPFADEKTSGLSSLGSDVTSWDGSSNHVDSNVTTQNKEKESDSDEELDRGKIKKVKTHQETTPRPQQNPFDQFTSQKDDKPWNSGFNRSFRKDKKHEWKYHHYWKSNHRHHSAPYHHHHHHHHHPHFNNSKEKFFRKHH